MGFTYEPSSVPWQLRDVDCLGLLFRETRVYPLRQTQLGGSPIFNADMIEMLARTVVKSPQHEAGRRCQ